MRVIWKFELNPYDTVKSMPKGADILSIQIQDGKICFWAWCESTAEKEDRKFIIIGTGNQIKHLKRDCCTFLGTIQEPGLVWHIFEIIK